jgi:hypothetical protein
LDISLIKKSKWQRTKSFVCLGVRCHIVHLASGDAVDSIRKAKFEDGLPLSVETCHHYLNIDAKAQNNSYLRFPSSIFTAQSKHMYSFPSLFAVDTFRHFGPRILNSQILFWRKNWHFGLFFPMWIIKFADKKSANNEGCLYHFNSFSLKGFSLIVVWYDVFLLLVQRDKKYTKNATFYTELVFVKKILLLWWYSKKIFYVNPKVFSENPNIFVC